MTKPTIDPDLSDDAKCVLGGWFGMGPCTALTLHLVESRPTARTQKALDELVAKKYLSVEPFNRFGGVVYKPLRDVQHYLRWLSSHKKAGRFTLIEPINGGSNGIKA